MVVVDVGANVGFHTVVAARAVSPRGHVYAVEPVPWTVAVLQANVWRHGCGDVVTVLPVAAGAAADEMELAIPAEGRSGTELAPLGSGGARVRLEPLDELVPAGAVDLLKIDVEGAELGVLAGAERLLEESPRLVVVVEFRPREPVAGTAPEAVLALYEGLGFELCSLGRDGRPRPATLHELARLDHETVNIVLRRPLRR